MQGIKRLIEVDRETFYRTLGTQDVIGRITSRYPYHSVYKLRDGSLVGESQDYEFGKPSRYYLVKEDQR